MIARMNIDRDSLIQTSMQNSSICVNLRLSVAKKFVSLAAVFQPLVAVLLLRALRGKEKIDSKRTRLELPQSPRAAMTEYFPPRSQTSWHVSVGNSPLTIHYSQFPLHFPPVLC